jgi:hypothetical protein
MSTQSSFARLGALALAAAPALLVALAACSGDATSPAARQPLDAASFHRSNGNGNGRGNNNRNLHPNHDRYRNRSRGHGHGQVGNASVEGIAVLGADRLTRLTLSTGTVDPLVAGDENITKVKVKAYTPDGRKLYTTNFEHLTPAGIQTLSLNGLSAGSILYIRAHVRGDRPHSTNCGCNHRDGHDNDRGRGHDDDHNRGRGHDDDRSRRYGDDRNDHHGGGDHWDNRHDDDDDDCDDDPRTDVVTLVDTVKAAPALNVDLSPIGKVLPNAPTVITATVTETGGDLGTTANCSLYVNGVKVDQAEDIWVDAGDMVTCAFTYTFRNPGRQTVEVRVNGTSAVATVPVDSDSTSFDVTNPVQATYSATVEDKSTAVTTILDYTWTMPDGGHKEYSNTEVTTTRTQTVSLQGAFTRAVSFPITTVDLKLESSDIAWEVEHWDALASTVDGAGQACTNQQMPDQGAIFFICNTVLGNSATFGYSRFAGSVTYHSEGFSNTFDGVTGTPDNYTWNDTYPLSTSGGQIRPFGSQVKITLQVRDAIGTWGVAPVVNLSTYSLPSVVTLPRTCEVSSPYWLNGGSMNSCNTGSTREFGSTGTATG